MIGIIVTGHGKFASGLTASVELITGTHEHYKAIDFDGVISQEELLKEIETEISNMSDCENIIIFTDLIGGTPFKMAATATLKYNNLQVFGGTNIGMIIETVMSRNFASDINSYVKQIEQTGKNQVTLFENKAPEVEVDDEEDGI